MHRYRLPGSVGAYCEASNMANIRALLGLSGEQVVGYTIIPSRVLAIGRFRRWIRFFHNDYKLREPKIVQNRRNGR